MYPERSISEQRTILRNIYSFRWRMVACKGYDANPNNLTREIMYHSWITCYCDKAQVKCKKATIILENQHKAHAKNPCYVLKIWFYRYFGFPPTCNKWIFTTNIAYELVCKQIYNSDLEFSRTVYQKEWIISEWCFLG